MDSRKQAKNAKFRIIVFLCAPVDSVKDMLCAFAREVPRVGRGMAASGF